MGDPLLISPRLRCLLGRKWNETTPKKYFRCIVGVLAVKPFKRTSPLIPWGLLTPLLEAALKFE